MIWQTIESHCEQIHGKKPLLKGGWGRACACLANCKTEITPRCIFDIHDTSFAACCILDEYDISSAVCVYCVVLCVINVVNFYLERCVFFAYLCYVQKDIFPWALYLGAEQSDVVCCMQRCILHFQYKLLRTEVFSRAQVWWAKIWARHRVCWISGCHPEIICCFGLCCIAICGRLTKAKKRVSLDVPHNMQFIYKAKCVYTCSALVAWDQGA